MLYNLKVSKYLYVKPECQMGALLSSEYSQVESIHIHVCADIHQILIVAF